MSLVETHIEGYPSLCTVLHRGIVKLFGDKFVIQGQALMLLANTLLLLTMYMDSSFTEPQKPAVRAAQFCAQYSTGYTQFFIMLFSGRSVFQGQALMLLANTLAAVQAAHGSSQSHIGPSWFNNSWKCFVLVTLVSPRWMANSCKCVVLVP